MHDADWSDGNARSLGVLLDGRTQATGIRRRGSDQTLLIVFNAYHGVVQVTLVEVTGGKKWVRLVDTNQPEADETDTFEFDHVYDVTGRSVVMFKLQM